MAQKNDPPRDLGEAPPVALPTYVLVDVEGDFLVSWAETERELLPHAKAWADNEDFVTGGLAIYRLSSVLEI